jgi:uncharacterized protein YqeY
MTILQDIKTASLAARKAHETANASSLITLLSEASMIGKNANRDTTDAETVAVIKKFIKNIDETLAVLNKGSSAWINLSEERLVYSSFLPKQLNEAEILAMLKDIVRKNNIALTPKAKGEMLKVLKAEHEGLYDGAVAARLAIELIASGVL